MNDILIQDFIQLISANTGLHIREQDKKTLSKKIYARMHSLKLSSPQQYYQLLNTHHDSNSTKNPLSENEWQELILLLTVGETYFFRDQGQLNLLKNQILPEVIANNKKLATAQGQLKPSLRLWSAGCSTGEEPYSLAILLKELISDIDQWNILILGTDINPLHIEKAKRGIYDSWSFRMVSPELQKKYFHQKNNTWKLDESIRKMVTFSLGNLLKDSFPNSHIYNIDIIVCRNVFIYFESNTISKILEKFYNTLISGGYLIAGHTELYGQNLGQFHSKVFSESIVYHRNQNSQNQSPIEIKPPTSSKNISPIKIAEAAPAFKFNHNASNITPLAPSTLVGKAEIAKNKNTQEALSQAKAFFHNGDYTAAIKQTQVVSPQYVTDFDACYLMAQSFANLGKCEQAIHYCQQALKLNSQSISPYYLLARIAETQGDVNKAKNLLRKIICIAPSSIAAYLELSSIYNNEGDTTRAKKMRDTAFELLAKLPHDVMIEHYSKITVGELIIQLQKL